MFLTGSANAVPDSFIWINVSVKVIVDPATGATPATMSDAVLRDSFTDMNRWLAVNFRGFRLRMVDRDANLNFKRIGAQNDLSGPCQWYDKDLKENETNYQGLQSAAKLNKALYGWNDNAVNIYFNDKYYSRAGFPSESDDMIISSYALLHDDKPAGAAFTQTYKIAGNLLHEIGHHFELYHTKGGPGTPANDDNIADTAKDPNNFGTARNETLVRNNIAQFNYTLNYNQLGLAEQRLVDNTANNAMAYIQLFYDDPAQNKIVPDAERFGPTRFVFTEQQMDKWSDWATSHRLSQLSGRTWFVHPSASNAGTGTSASPVKLVNGVSAANNNGNDILLLKPGTHAVGTISKPMTLRASRAGAAILNNP